MSVLDLAKKYVELCTDQRFDEALSTLYARDAVSVEAMPRAPEARGLDAIVAKGRRWAEGHEIHGVKVEGPFPNGDRFIVRFVMDVTIKAASQRVTMDEMALFTVADGKIVREEFFYTT